MLFNPNLNQELNTDAETAELVTRVRTFAIGFTNTSLSLRDETGPKILLETRRSADSSLTFSQLFSRLYPCPFVCSSEILCQLTYPTYL